MLLSAKKVACKIIRNLYGRFAFMRSKRRGGVLIEFALSIPIFILVLFLVSDHYRFHELRNKLKNSTYLIASMLQNITNTRRDKHIQIKDLKQIAFSSCLNFFHTDSMFNPWPFGLSWYVKMIYVKKTGNSEYKAFQFEIDTGETNYKTIDEISCVCSELTNLTDPTTIDKEMVFYNVNDEKLFINVAFKSKDTSREVGIFNKSRLGLYMLSIQNDTFTHNFVYTPKPGLFNCKKIQKEIEGN